MNKVTRRAGNALLFTGVLVAWSVIAAGVYSQREYEVDIITESLNDAGVSVFYEHQRIPDSFYWVCDDTRSIRGFFFATDYSGVAGITICDKLHGGRQVVRTLMHEVGHVLQWCKSRKPMSNSDLRPMGGIDLSQSSIMYAEDNYSALPVYRRIMEAEAEEYRKHANPLSVGPDLSTLCE